MKKTTSIAIAVLVITLPLAAEDLQIELDSELTSVNFRLQATLHSVHGSAAAASGSLGLNTESGTVVGHVTIDATTAETGNNKRDKKMHAKVLRTNEYSWIVFRAERLEGELALTGASDVVLHGTMEILGASHEIELPLHVEIEDSRFRARSAFDVPYVEWGLEDPSTFVLRVAKVVEVTVEAEGTIDIVD